MAVVSRYQVLCQEHEHSGNEISDELRPLDALRLRTLLGNIEIWNSRRQKITNDTIENLSKKEDLSVIGKGRHRGGKHESF